MALCFILLLVFCGIGASKGDTCLLLREYGVFPYEVAPNFYGYSLLHYAAEGDLSDHNLGAVSQNASVVVQMLLKCYEEYDRLHERVTATSRNGNTPLCRACRYGSEATVRLLVEAGSELEFRCQGGKTPLLIAAGWGTVANVKVLLQAGADTTAVSNRRHGLLWYAKYAKAAYRRPDVLDYLKGNNLV